MKIEKYVIHDFWGRCDSLLPESILDCKSVEITKHFPLPAGSFSETSTFFQVQKFQVQKIRFIFRFIFQVHFFRFILQVHFSGSLFQVQFFRFISRFSFSGSFSRFSFQVHLFRFIFQVQKCKHSRNIRLTLCKTFQVPTWRNIIIISISIPKSI